VTFLAASRWTALLATAWTLFAAQASAEAPPPEDVAPPRVGGVIPPQPLEIVEPEYPPALRARREEVNLVLRLTIDASGSVTAAEVTERTAEGFDEAARAALLRSRFVPASRNGQPIAATILYRVRFSLPPEPAPALSAPPVVPPVPAPEPVAPPPAAPPSVPEPRKAGEPLEVTVAGERSEADLIQRSAAPVTVVELTRHKRRSADLGEVLGRTFGVSIRRTGGLGSDTRFSLNGLEKDQVRLLINGIPIEHSFPSSISNIPVDLLDRVEIYRGVVPVSYASDALGGALNVVTNRSFEPRVGGSYQLGSFGTRRATLFGRYSQPGGGLALGLEAFADGAKNDYEVDVEVPDERGRLHPARLPRFHDRYRAYGVALDAGVVDVPWASRLIVRGLRVAYDQQLQNNLVMTVPYGEAFYGESLNSLQLQYEHTLLPGLELEARASYARNTTHFSDQSAWVYDWYGRRVRERRIHGEIENEPHDQEIWDDSAFARVGLRYQPLAGHSFRLATSSDFTNRTGDERIQSDPAARDPLTAKQDLFKQVSGFEYELGLFRKSNPGRISDSDGRVEHVVQNIAFLKSYLYRVDSEEPLPGGIFRERDQDRHRFGIGDGVRVLLTDFLYAKASYELATRLPKTFEVFGDGILVRGNLQLQPEISDNANLGARLELEETAAGDVMVDVNAFMRDTQNQIVLLGGDRFFTHQNVFRAVSRGIEGAFEYHAPRRIFAFDGSFTWTDLRNQSESGAFESFRGDRIPHRPWLMAAFGARMRLTRLFDARDELEPFYTARFVHEYYRGWESVGLKQSKQVVPSQLVHGAGVTYSLRRGTAAVWTTLEVQNFTDQPAFDLFAQERPGRSFSLKVTAASR
jgi:vitamin B12 transporter